MESAAIVFFIPCMLLIFYGIICYLAWKKEKVETPRMGETPMKYDVIPLPMCPTNATVWVEFLDCGKESIKRLKEFGIEEDAYIRVLEAHPGGVRLSTQDNQVVRLGPVSANMVLVRIMRMNGRWTKPL